MAPTQALPPLWSADTTNPRSATRTTIILLSIILGIFSATLFFIIALIVHKLCNVGVALKPIPSLCKYSLAKTLEAGNMIVQLSGILGNAGSTERARTSSEISHEDCLHHKSPKKSETHPFETRSIRAGSDVLPGGRAYATRRIYKRSSMSEQIDHNTSDPQHSNAGDTYPPRKVSRAAAVQALKRTQTS